jgi:hypothetical protein
MGDKKKATAARPNVYLTVHLCDVARNGNS